MTKECTIYTNKGNPPHQVAIVADDDNDRHAFASKERMNYLKNKYGMNPLDESPLVPLVIWPPKDLDDFKES